ncbi:hypothetical protein [Bacteriovorax sp. DB6_IX]|uniref:hypothetical protein n=1 Tax=Bacteriovorax sp. DB6_IX TaxID=1353530 RepID=UPI000553E0AE|nr:hypothetical protein [Bacteriovorax sp. DB6_IX]
MVIRILLLLSLSMPALAYKFRDALRSYKKGNYQRSIQILERMHGTKTKFYPNKSLMLLAKNYENLDEHVKALKMYFFILKKNYRKQDAQVRKVLKSGSDIDEIDELPKGMLKVYYALFQSYVAIYEKHGYEKYRDMAIKYGELLNEQEYKEDRVEKLLAGMAQVKKLKEDSQQRTQYYIGLAYSTWQDQLTLKAPSGTESTIKSSAEGTTLFGIMTMGNLFNEYRFEASITRANATVGEDDTDFEYFQTNVAEIMMTLSAGYMWKTSQSVAIGVSAPIVYRTGDFTQPETFQLDKTDMLTIGLLGNLSWNISTFLVDVKFGKLLGFHSSFAQVGVAYKF